MPIVNFPYEQTSKMQNSQNDADFGPLDFDNYDDSILQQYFMGEPESSQTALLGATLNDTKLVQAPTPPVFDNSPEMDVLRDFTPPAGFPQAPEVHGFEDLHQDVPTHSFAAPMPSLPAQQASWMTEEPAYNKPVQKICPPTLATHMVPYLSSDNESSSAISSSPHSSDELPLPLPSVGASMSPVGAGSQRTGFDRQDDFSSRYFTDEDFAMQASQLQQQQQQQQQDAVRQPTMTTACSHKRKVRKTAQSGPALVVDRKRKRSLQSSFSSSKGLDGHESGEDNSLRAQSIATNATSSSNSHFRGLSEEKLLEIVMHFAQNVRVSPSYERVQRQDGSPDWILDFTPLQKYLETHKLSEESDAVDDKDTGVEVSPVMKISPAVQERQQSTGCIPTHISVQDTSDISADDARLIARFRTFQGARKRGLTASQREGKFFCTQGCGWRHNTKGNWERHERSHFPQDLWVCRDDQCAGLVDKKRVFLRKDLLRRHLRSHASSAETITPMDLEKGRVVVEGSEYPKVCVFERCNSGENARFGSFEERLSHLAKHFEARDQGAWRVEAQPALLMADEAGTAVSTQSQQPHPHVTSRKQETDAHTEQDEEDEEDEDDKADRYNDSGSDSDNDDYGDGSAPGGGAAGGSSSSSSLGGSFAPGNSYGSYGGAGGSGGDNQYHYDAAYGGGYGSYGFSCNNPRPKAVLRTIEGRQNPVRPSNILNQTHNDDPVDHKHNTDWQQIQQLHWTGSCRRCHHFHARTPVFIASSAYSQGRTSHGVNVNGAVQHQQQQRYANCEKCGARLFIHGAPSQYRSNSESDSVPSLLSISTRSSSPPTTPLPTPVSTMPAQHQRKRQAPAVRPVVKIEDNDEHQIDQIVKRSRAARRHRLHQPQSLKSQPKQIGAEITKVTTALKPASSFAFGARESSSSGNDCGGSTRASTRIRGFKELLRRRTKRAQQEEKTSGTDELTGALVESRTAVANPDIPRSNLHMAKAYCGHSEAVAGLTSLLKVAMLTASSNGIKPPSAGLQLVKRDELASDLTPDRARACDQHKISDSESFESSLQASPSFVLCIGNSGAGKSTLIKNMLNMEESNMWSLGRAYNNVPCRLDKATQQQDCQGAPLLDWALIDTPQADRDISYLLGLQHSSWRRRRPEVFSVKMFGCQSCPYGSCKGGSSYFGTKCDLNRHVRTKHHRGKCFGKGPGNWLFMSDNDDDEHDNNDDYEYDDNDKHRRWRPFGTHCLEPQIASVSEHELDPGVSSLLALRLNPRDLRDVPKGSQCSAFSNVEAKALNKSVSFDMETSRSADGLLTISHSNHKQPDSIRCGDNALGDKLIGHRASPQSSPEVRTCEASSLTWGLSSKDNLTSGYGFVFEVADILKAIKVAKCIYDRFNEPLRADTHYHDFAREVRELSTALDKLYVEVLDRISAFSDNKLPQEQTSGNTETLLQSSQLLWQLSKPLVDMSQLLYGLKKKVDGLSTEASTGRLRLLNWMSASERADPLRERLERQIRKFNSLNATLTAINQLNALQLLITMQTQSGNDILGLLANSKGKLAQPGANLGFSNPEQIIKVYGTDQGLHTLKTTTSDDWIPTSLTFEPMGYGTFKMSLLMDACHTLSHHWKEGSVQDTPSLNHQVEYDGIEMKGLMLQQAENAFSPPSYYSLYTFLCPQGNKHMLSGSNRITNGASDGKGDYDESAEGRKKIRSYRFMETSTWDSCESPGQGFRALTSSEFFPRPPVANIATADIADSIESAMYRDCKMGLERFTDSRICKKARTRDSAKISCVEPGCGRGGFRGHHELQRHMDRFHHHRTARKVWICVDASPEKDTLSGCRACASQKTYGQAYNAAAHLRRMHFSPRSKSSSKSSKTMMEPGTVTSCAGKRKRGGDDDGGGGGGGSWPPIEELRKSWMKEVVVDEEEEEEKERRVPITTADDGDEVMKDVDAGGGGGGNGVRIAEHDSRYAHDEDGFGIYDHSLGQDKLERGAFAVDFM